MSKNETFALKPLLREAYSINHCLCCLMGELSYLYIDNGINDGAKQESFEKGVELCKECDESATKRAEKLAELMYKVDWDLLETIRGFTDEIE